MKFRNMEEGKRFLLTKYQTRKDYAVTEVNFIPFAFFYRLIWFVSLMIPQSLLQNTGGFLILGGELFLR